MFLSRPYLRRIGLIPMSIFTALAWLLIPLTFALASLDVRYLILWGSIMWLAVAWLSMYIVLLTYRWIKDSQERHELVLDGDLISLTTVARKQMNGLTQQISLREVTFAEYYEPRDTANLLLRGRVSSLEIPLWSFGPEAEKKIVDYVRMNGIEVLGIPSSVLI